MQNLIAFINEWLSYFLVFVVFAALVTAAVILGIKTRIHKDKKDALAAEQGTGQQTPHITES